MTTYVIRENCFYYGDDYDYFEGTKIEGCFYSRGEAEAVYKKLEVEAIQWIILEHQESLFCADKKFLQELDDFVFSCCGEHILIEGSLQMKLPENMQEDDIFEFIKRAKIEKYQIFEFEDESVFYAIWLNYEEEWAYRERATGTYLIYDLSEEIIWQEANGGYCVNSPEDFIFKGKIEDITDSPILFRSILQELKFIQYDEENQKLTIDKYDMDGIIAINPLLKSPIFEVKALSLAEILELEQEIRQKKSKNMRK